ncbi:ATP-dependent RNA helicase dbp3 [Cyphellophora attinorum]|uniref:RNA helicase n=1 Tax=Cyphellophora attinorum TaxID=1664694 RepID=A0A0N0NMF2_9EURO|nr:ATP-dependent RNA helicase dbp3 [Phialophora attinorum]KPI40129.1 ATP-dependent RNA helicase dbp3 [Phialophora attinorum]
MSKHRLDDGAQSDKQERKRRKKERKEALKSEILTPPTSTDATAASTPVPEEGHEDNESSYKQSKSLTALPQADIDSFLTTDAVQIKDPQSTSDTLRPILSFDQLPPELASQFAPIFSTFKKPSAIQSAAWPFLLSGRDVVGIAETGSGKTLAFGLPLVARLSTLNKKKGIRAVIVAPTRELAIQVHEQIAALCAATPTLKSTCVYGGSNKDEQRRTLKHANVIVATPGRLKDFMSDGTISLSKTRYLVLDEADRMLDKGFEDDIKQIISSMPASGTKRQTAMFTATWPKSIRDLAATFMTTPTRIIIGQEPAQSSGDLRANTRIKQIVEHTAGPKSRDRILVFCLYKKEASRVESFISQRGYSVAGIHGDLKQSDRLASLSAFKSGTSNILVATDVAARGLDIPEVKVVINVTFPLTAEDYVHRIGRTGRAGKEGLAVTMFTEHDKPLAGALVNVLKGAGQPVPEDLLKFGTTVKKKTHDAYGAFGPKEDLEGKTATKITFD